MFEHYDLIGFVGVAVGIPTVVNSMPLHTTPGYFTNCLPFLKIVNTVFRLDAAQVWTMRKENHIQSYKITTDLLPRYFSFSALILHDTLSFGC